MSGVSVLRPGDVQHMTAGTGVAHSEMNASATEPAHLIQIWILPERRGLTPDYQERHFSIDERRNRLRPIVAPDRREDALPISQDAAIFASILDKGAAVTHELAAGRCAWMQVARGAVTLNGARLSAGDGAAVQQESALRISAAEPSEILVFDLV
jgi:redox-sensitive bicupin YhaK (pirin superfamily)